MSSLLNGSWFCEIWPALLLAGFWGLSAGLSYELPMIADEIRKGNKLIIIVKYNQNSGEADWYAKKDEISRKSKNE